MNYTPIIVYILDVIICLGFSIFTLRYFPKKNMNIFIKIVGFIFLYFNFMMIMILPYDMYYTYHKQDAIAEGKGQQFQRMERPLIVTYYMNFTILFYGNKSLIAFLIGYMKSGELLMKYRIFDGAKSAAIKIAMVLILMNLLVPFLMSYDFLVTIFTAYQIYNLIYAYMYIGVTIVKLPKKMHLLSDLDKTLDYYQFKTYKKNLSIKKNNEKIVEYLHQCKLTMEFVNKKEKENDLNDIEEEDDNIIKNDEEKSIESNDNKINNNNLEDKDNENAKKDKKKKKRKISLKELIEYKNYLDLLLTHIQELMKANEINIDENQKPENEIKIFANKKEIVKANEKLKNIERENEKNKKDIPNYYQKWNLFKTIKMNVKSDLSSQKNQTLEENQEDIKEALNEENFIPSQKISKKKLQFFAKFHKAYYLILMALSILGGIIIILSENTLFLPVNTSFFSLMYNGGKILSFIAYFCFAFILFYYATYSTKFTKLKLFGESFKLSPKNKTNTVSFLSFIEMLSDFSGPVCTNIIKILKHANEKQIQTVIEKEGPKMINTKSFTYFESYLSLIIIVIIIITYFELMEKMCKKKAKVQFNIKSEERDNYIKEGKDFLINLNKEYLGEFKISD